MASDNEASCASDPNFAVICSFLECFGKPCGIVYPDIARLQEMLENTQDVPQQLIDLHIKLLRKTRKTVSPEKWERALVKFCHTYSNQDGWELERFGYKKARIAVKLRLLKVLLESQFDLNQKFKNEVNKLAAQELRVEPLGRDKSGLVYWCQLDEECNIRVYKEDLDEESWELVAKDRDGVVNLISTLSNGEVECLPINEDSNSLEISEKPITDTGQIEGSPSLEDEVVQENGLHADDSEEKETEKDENEDSVDQTDDENDPEEDEEDDDETINDESSKQSLKEEHSQEAVAEKVIDTKSINPEASLAAEVSKGSADKAQKLEEQIPQEAETTPKEIVSDTAVSAPKFNDPVKEDATIIRNSTSNIPGESSGIKSIETPVITSPLKLVNITELKPTAEEKYIAPVIPVTDSPITMTKRHNAVEDNNESVLKSIEKLTGKNNLSFSAVDVTTHNKISFKPIDKLAANLVRIQSEKLEKPSGAKTLEKIAENLARTNSVLSNAANGEDDRLPQDFCARSQADKTVAHRGHRGMDLSASPRGWESANEQSRPMDFSGMDLSSRKFTKPVDLPSPGYRPQDIQHREMDLSTKKLNKPDVQNVPYDARSVMLRNQAMVADLSKRQMSYPYEMSSPAYHNTGRIVTKDEHRLPSYTILPDPSKLAALRMGAASMKRPLDAEDVQQDMLKRLRADVIPIRGSMDKRPMLNSNWRDEVGEAIEEPVMMVQGEGSGSDCDAVNPWIGEAVEEPPIFFYGEGSGAECNTGNPGDDTSTDNKESAESKSEADSATANLSPTKILPDDSLTNELSNDPVVANKNVIKLNRNFPQTSVSLPDHCQTVGSTQEKPKFKPTLGVQIIPKTSSGTTKRLSRWDVGKPENKTECDSSIITNEGDISLIQSTNDLQDNEISQKLSNESIPKLNAESEASSADDRHGDNVEENIGSSVEMPGEDKSECCGSAGREDEQNCSVINDGSAKNQESLPCDSSISTYRADSEIHSTTKSDESLESDNDEPTKSESNGTDQNSPDKTVSDCKLSVASPPRFFFGPNCISYTSKSEDSDAKLDSTIATPVECKSNTLQYEAVSSSKLSDSVDSQTNNNSLKVTSMSAEQPSANDKYEKTEDVEPSEAREKQVSEECEVEAKEEPRVAQDNSSGSVNSDKETPEQSQTTDSPSTLPSKDLLPHEKTGETIVEASPESTNLKSDEIEKISENLEASNVSNSVAPATDFPAENEVDDKSCDSEVFNEDSEKDDASTTAESSQADVLPRQLENSNNFCATSDSPNLTTVKYNEVDSSEMRDMDNSTNHFPSHMKSDADSSGENYDKPSDKMDNLSEFDAQEGQLTNSDIEKMKGLAGSDTDSMCVNFDKSSERNYAFSDLGAQDEGSRDSDETKEKSLTEPLDKEGQNLEVDMNNFAHSSAATCSEVTEESEKDTVSPVVSSTHESFVQDASLQDTSSQPNTIEDTENASPSNLEFISACVQPAEVSESQIVKKDSNFSGLIQALNEEADNVSQNPSSSIDQDSNQEMVIDERISEFNESSKEDDEVTLSDEKLCLHENSLTDKNIVNEDASSPQSDIAKKSQADELDETRSIANDNNLPGDDAVTEKILISDEHAKADEESERKPSEDEQEFVKHDQHEVTAPVPEKVEDKQLEEIEQRESAVDFNQSLVANYDSNDSNDAGSDDVFEAETPDVDVPENSVPCDMNKEENSKKEVEEFNESITEVKEGPHAESSEPKPNEIADEASDVDKNVYADNAVNNKLEVPDNQCKLSESVISEDNDEKKACKLSADHDLSKSIKDSELTALSEPTETKNEIFLNEPATEEATDYSTNISLSIDSTRISADEKINCLSPGTQKTIDSIPENLPDLEKRHGSSVITATAELKEHVNQWNDIGKQSAIGEQHVNELKEQQVKITDECLLANFNHGKKFSKDVDTKDSDAANLVDIKPFEEFKKETPEQACHSNEVSLGKTDPHPESPESLVVDKKLDEQKVCKTETATVLEEAKPVVDFANNIKPSVVENSEGMDVLDKSIDPLNMPDKVLEDLDNKPPLANDAALILKTEEGLLAEENTTKDQKIESNERSAAAEEVQSVPPLKSKLPCEDSVKSEFDSSLNSEVSAPLTAECAISVAVPEDKKEGITGHLAKEEAPVINEIVDHTNAKEQEKKETITELHNVEVKGISSDDSMDGDNECIFNAAEADVDPLAGTDDDAIKKLTETIDLSDSKIALRVKPVTDVVYEGWKLDGTESPKLSRKRRNSAHESNSEDLDANQEEDEATAGKRIKLGAKRLPDKELRKAVEESRVGLGSSEDETGKDDGEKTTEEESKVIVDDSAALSAIATDPKIRGRPRGRRRRGNRSSRYSRQKRSETQNAQTAETSSENLQDGTTPNVALDVSSSTIQKRRKKRKMVLGLEIGRDIAPEEQGSEQQDETPVRQSRRIAQLKIKEQADRRRIEEEALSEMKDKKDSEKKKKRKQKVESDEETPTKELEKDKKSKKKRKKRKRKKMLAKFNEAKPWQSSSGSSSDEDNENEDDEDDEDDMESEGSLLFKSDHEFSPESDLEKDQEAEPLRRARTAQKAQSDDEEADDEYACQKCGKADHPEWILLCDTCDKGWHCSCLRPALMLIPEGDWFCPPCQHNLLVSKLRENLKTYDQLMKRHENEILRKKRLAFVGISLDNVLHKNDAPQSPKESREEESSQESDNESTSTSSETSSENSSSEESEPVYQLRERRCANTYKFNEYDDMINAAIQDEVEAVQGAGNQGRGKDIATIVNAEKEEAQLQLQAEAMKLNENEIAQDKEEELEEKVEKESDEEYKVEKDDEALDDEEEEQKIVNKKLLARRKHRKLNSLDISSEDDPESDEDFKGTSSEEEEDFDDHITSSDDSSIMDIKRRGKKGDSRPVRRSTRARMTRYDDDFINDDSDESDRPKRKKSRSMWGDSDSEDSDNSWRQKKKKSRTVSASRCRTSSKSKTKKKKKRKRILESDNQSDNDEEDDAYFEGRNETLHVEPAPQEISEPVITNNERIEHEISTDVKDEILESALLETTVPQLEEIIPQKKKKENVPKQKKIRRKIIYGGLPDDNAGQEEETLGRRTRGRKINYQEEMASDSEEELKKALRKTGESEDEFVVNEGDDINEDAEKDSDSGDIYTPKKDAPKFKNRSPKNKKLKKSRSPGMKRRTLSEDGTPKQRRKPGPKPGSKNKPRKQNLTIASMMYSKDGDVMGQVLDNPLGDSKKDDDLSENVGLSGTAMSMAGSFTGDVPEGSLTSLGPGELAELDDEQLEQMMMEDEEYGRRQLELAAIEIAKKKKKEEREAKKLEKARLKALEILAAERQRDPNALEGTDGEVPKKKKRGRRSKAEILAEQMRRDGAPEFSVSGLPQTGIPDMANAVNPSLSASSETDRTSEGHLPLITGPDGQLFNPDGSPLKPKRRGRGKGKKTLALEAARAAEAAAKAAAEVGLIGMGTDSNSESKPGDNLNILPTPGSSTSGSAPSTPPAGVITTQGPPSTQPSNSQVYPSIPPNQQSSVITRMLQSQPVANSPQSFTAAAVAMGHKYFGGPNAAGQIMAGPRTGYEMQPRGRIPSPYRQPGQATIPPHFAAVRSGTPPMRMRVPGPQMYHTPHHPMDPSPSGGGPISINNRDRSSPLGPGPAMIPPAAGSPLAKGGPTPPPPPYVRGGPALSRFQDNPMAGPRHQLPPFPNASPGNHGMQQPSPPPNRPPGNFSPYHPPPPPNYHYGAYPPPPPMSTADDAAAYQGSPYPTEHFSSPADGQPNIQAPQPPQGPPPPPQQPQPHPNDGPPGSKQYDEEGTGEFGGLVSYFSSQREDDLDS